MAKSILGARFWAVHTPWIEPSQSIDNAFFGINIAPSEDPRVDQFIIDRLHELGLQHVRMDFTYESLSSHAERLLNIVLDAGFQVMLDLLPPFDDAKDFDRAAQQRWHDFVVTVADKYGERLTFVEIGSTPNRGKWSGFEPFDYLTAWDIAHQALTERHITVVGPNVSDFEPLCTIQLLSEMQRKDRRPDINTNNLFVERVVQPEVYDHRALGKIMTKVMKLNLVKKAKVMRHIGQQYGIDKLICTYKCWSTKRLRRWSIYPEQKKTDYLIRYLVIAATSGALEKVYWGPMVCSRDGLISDGSTGYPVIDNVTFYRLVRGNFDDYQVKEAFYAYAQLIHLLSGSRCIQAVNQVKGLHHFIFEMADNKQLHMMWTMDRGLIPLSDIYSSTQLAQGRYLDPLGNELTKPVLSVTERPLSIIFDEAVNPIKDKDGLETLDSRPFDRIVGIMPNVQFFAHEQGTWRGMISIFEGEDANEKWQALLPEQLLSAPTISVHRDQRNRVWSIPNPLDDKQVLVVKENRAKGLKKFTYRFKASKGQRHWDNASEMLRRGVNSPMPIAYFERTENTGITHNYYVCDYVDVAFSVRQAFTAFNEGEESYHGFDKQQVLKVVADYCCHLHNEKIIHHDLTGGNLLVTIEDGQMVITAIDIGRATIQYKSRVRERQRLLDLMRCCYKLGWQDREAFMSLYFEAYGRTFDAPWRKSLAYYDWKLKAKKGLKKALKKGFKPKR